MKILIAEDDRISRLLLQKTLGKMGHEIMVTENGEQAWQAFQAHEPDMVISDWMMPEMDGLDLCRRIRISPKKTYSYIILLTARDTTTDLVEVFDAGADDYIIKPFKPDELRSRIKSGERIAALESRHHELQEKLMEKNKVLDQALQDLKQSQAQILQSERMASLGRLAAGVAHEINNPLGFVSSNLDTLLHYLTLYNHLLGHYQALAEPLVGIEEKSLPGTIKERLETIGRYEQDMDIDFLKQDIPELLQDCIQGIGRVGKIVADLRGFALPGQEKPMRVDINKGLESTLNVVANELKSKAVVIKEFGQIPLVQAWPQKLNQVFMNILVNAAQAIPEKGEIRIQTFARDNQVKIRIYDTGTGIPKENLAKLFDPFFTTREVGKGTGLGLNMAYRIVQEHGGEIEVQTEEGKGACFTITLPIK